MAPVPNEGPIEIPTLRGRHVQLEPLSLDHVDALAAAGGADRDSFGYTPVPHDAESARRYVELALADHAVGRVVPFAVRDLATGTVVGSTRFLDLEVFVFPPPWQSGIPAPRPDADHPPTVAEVGATWYSAAAQGTAVNPEAKLLLFRHAFGSWRVERVTLKTDARNERSRRAILGVGALFEGIRRVQTTATDGTLRDTAYYSIVAAEWPEVEARLTSRLAALP